MLFLRGQRIEFFEQCDLAVDTRSNEAFLAQAIQHRILLAPLLVHEGGEQHDTRTLGVLHYGVDDLGDTLADYSSTA